MVIIIILASLFVGHAAQKLKLRNLQYDEGGNHMAEAEEIDKKINNYFTNKNIVNLKYIGLCNHLLKQHNTIKVGIYICGG